jgi:excinuclease ABC subunit A
MMQLEHLVDAGNTVFVVEHDLRVIAACDWVIDMGPGGGNAGGHVVASGIPGEIVNSPTSRTAAYLRRANQWGEVVSAIR